MLWVPTCRCIKPGGRCSMSCVPRVSARSPSMAAGHPSGRHLRHQQPQQRESRCDQNSIIVMLRVSTAEDQYRNGCAREENVTAVCVCTCAYVCACCVHVRARVPCGCGCACACVTAQLPYTAICTLACTATWLPSANVSLASKVRSTAVSVHPRSAIFLPTEVDNGIHC